MLQRAHARPACHQAARTRPGPAASGRTAPGSRRDASRFLRIRHFTRARRRARQPAHPASTRCPRDPSAGCRAFDSTIAASSRSLSSATSAATQSSVSDTPASLCRSACRSSCTNAVTCARESRGRLGHPRRDDPIFLVEVRIRNPVIQTAALERVVHLRACGWMSGPRSAVRRRDGAELGNRHLVVGEQLQQKPLELFVRAIDLVDQQDRAASAGLLERLQQRALDQKRLA